MPAVGCCLEFPFDPGTDSSSAHDTGNTVFTALDSGINELPVDFRSSKDAMAGSMKNPDLVLQGAILAASAALWTIYPGMITGTGDLEQHAHTAYFEGPPVVSNEFEFHF